MHLPGRMSVFAPLRVSHLGEGRQHPEQRALLSFIPLGQLLSAFHALTRW